MPALSINPPTASSLIQQGITAYHAGDRTAAQAFLQQALAQEPGNISAWLWLSGAVQTPAERRHCLEQVLAIDPAHEAAQRALRALPGSAEVPAATSATSQPAPVAAVDPPANATLPTPDPSATHSSCAACAATIPADQVVLVHTGATDAPPKQRCPSCSATLRQALHAETSNSNLIRAALVGSGAAVIAALLWYGVVVVTGYQVGFLAVAVGYIVGKAIVGGAGGKRGTALQVLSVGVTLAAMACSEYLIARHILIEVLSDGSSLDIPLLLPVGMMLQLIWESIKSDPLTLVFWGIAAWTAFSLPAPRKLKIAQAQPAPATPAAN